MKAKVEKHSEKMRTRRSTAPVLQREPKDDPREKLNYTGKFRKVRIQLAPADVLGMRGRAHEGRD